MILRRLILALCLLPAGLAAQPDPVAIRLQQVLDSLRAISRAPAITAGIVLPDGRAIALVSGLADTATREPMRPDHRVLAGSVGKTWFAALALQLVAEGQLDLDAPVARYLGDAAWFARLPNAGAITVRMLMTHTSGLVRYEFDDRFIRDLLAAPDRRWLPEEQLAYLLDQPAPFPAGTGWEYSDTNYLVLGMILERITGRTAYAEIQRRFLDPLGLDGTIPSTSRDLPRLAQGYAGAGNPFGGRDAMLEAGRFLFNPQFEWAGGGFATTGGDLARWAARLYGGDLIPRPLLDTALAGVPARLGRDTRYGLGVIVWPTPLGRAVGHSGFFPGYLTEMRYWPDRRFAVAVSLTTSNGQALGASPAAITLRLAQEVRILLGQPPD